MIHAHPPKWETLRSRLDLVVDVYTLPLLRFYSMGVVPLLALLI